MSGAHRKTYVRWDRVSVEVLLENVGRQPVKVIEQITGHTWDGCKKWMHDHGLTIAKVTRLKYSGDIGRWIGVDASTVRRWCRNGLPAVKMGNGRGDYLIDHDDVRAWLMAPGRAYHRKRLGDKVDQLNPHTEAA